MEVFWIFAGLTGLGLTAYAAQLWSIRTILKGPKTYVSTASTAPSYTLPSADQSFLPPISILKPLCGLEDNLYDNLESFCRLDYPRFELILAFQDHNDPAHRVAVKIKNKYPDRDITIVVRRCTLGLNPKVNNLIPAYMAARHPFVLISDSNVMVDPSYLKESVSPFKDTDVVLVTNLIKGVRSRSMGARLENLHLNSFIIGSVCMLDRLLGMPCVIGKSMLIRKADLEAIGGLSAFKNVLAEDFIIGRELSRHRGRIVLSNHAVYNVNQYWGLRRFLNRHTRWGKLRWKIGGYRYLSELIGNIVFMACIPLAVLGPSTVTVSMATGIGLLKSLGDFYIGRKLGSDLRPATYALVPLKDLIIGAMWFVPLLSSRVAWRGKNFRICRDSRLLPLQDSPVSLRLRYARLFSVIRAKFA